MSRIKITIKLPDFCRTTKNPKFKIVEVQTPYQWLPTYEELADIMRALANCERENRTNGQKQYNLNEYLKSEKEVIE